MTTSGNRFRFDPTVNLGHILTMITLVITVILSYAHLDKRVSLLEQLSVIYGSELERLRSPQSSPGGP